jgi:adenosylhomocysteine nucleosidase
VKRILIVTALDVEARGLARHLALRRVGSRRPPRYAGSALDLICVGPGATCLGEFDALARAAGLVVSAGTCGALAPDLEVGDLVLPGAVLGPDGRRHALAPLSGLEAAGTLLTVPAVVETAEAKARLWRETGASAVDMEAALVAQWAAGLGVPAAAVRGVVDTASRGIPSAFANLVDPRGRTRGARAVHLVLTRPRGLADVLALRRDTARALRTIAGALLILTHPQPPTHTEARAGRGGAGPGRLEAGGGYRGGAAGAGEGPAGRRGRGGAGPGRLEAGGGYRGGAAGAPPDH